SAAVGDDLLKDADPLLEFGTSRRILRGLFCRVQRLDLKLSLTEPEEAVCKDHQENDRKADDDQREEDSCDAPHHSLSMGLELLIEAARSHGQASKGCPLRSARAFQAGP